MLILLYVTVVDIFTIKWNNEKACLFFCMLQLSIYLQLSGIMRKHAYSFVCYSCRYIYN